MTLLTARASPLSLFVSCFVSLVQVNRNNILEDSFAQVSAMNSGELRRWLRVRVSVSVCPCMQCNARRSSLRSVSCIEYEAISYIVQLSTVVGGGRAQASFLAETLAGRRHGDKIEAVG